MIVLFRGLWLKWLTPILNIMKWLPRYSCWGSISWVGHHEVFEGVDNEIETVLGSIAVYIDNLPQRMLYIWTKISTLQLTRGYPIHRDNNLKWNVVKPTLINNFSELISWILTTHLRYSWWVSIQQKQKLSSLGLGLDMFKDWTLFNVCPCNIHCLMLIAQWPSYHAPVSSILTRAWLWRPPYHIIIAKYQVSH